MSPSLREAGEVGGVEAVQQLRDPMLLPLRQHRAATAAADGVAVMLLKDTLNQIFSAVLDLQTLSESLEVLFFSGSFLMHFP